MPSYRLHYFPESGNSYKLALMLTLCGERFEPVWTDFAGGVTRTAEWRRDVNAMGEIPVLEVDGERRTQTAPILLQLAKQYGRFGGETEQEQFELLRWLFWDNHKLTGYMATYRYMRAFTPTPDPQVLKHFRRRLDDFLSILEGHMEKNAFAIGERATIADISMMAYLHYPTDETGYDLAASHPAIGAWLGRMAQLPGWKSAYDLLPGKRLTHYAKGKPLTG
jgi:glutathione S-transferase